MQCNNLIRTNCCLIYLIWFIHSETKFNEPLVQILNHRFQDWWGLIGVWISESGFEPAVGSLRISLFLNFRPRSLYNCFFKEDRPSDSRGRDRYGSTVSLQARDDRSIYSTHATNNNWVSTWWIFDLTEENRLQRKGDYTILSICTMTCYTFIIHLIRLCLINIMVSKLNFEMLWQPDNSGIVRWL